MIAETGGTVVYDTCIVSSHIDKLGFQNVVTSSAKAAYYLPSLIVVSTFFGSLEDCVDAAITGCWKGRV